jgi:hypothetical protein
MREKGREREREVIDILYGWHHSSMTQVIVYNHVSENSFSRHLIIKDR